MACNYNVHSSVSLRKMLSPWFWFWFVDNVACFIYFLIYVLSKSIFLKEMFLF